MDNNINIEKTLLETLKNYIRDIDPINLNQIEEIYYPIERIDEDFNKRTTIIKILKIGNKEFKIIKRIRDIFEDYRRCLRCLREMSMLLRLWRVDYTENLLDLSIPNEINLNNIYFIFSPKIENIHQLIKNDPYYKHENVIPKIMYWLIRGLRFLHSKGIIHRNIAPSNIFIDFDDKPKICGFSSAIMEKELNFINIIDGDFSYMAPEYLINSNRYPYSNKIDMWGVGVIMLELYSQKCHFFTDGNEIGPEEPRILNQIKLIFRKMEINCPRLQNLNIQREEDLIEIIRDSSNRVNQDVFHNILGNDLEDNALELLFNLLCIDPKNRVSAEDALKFPYFANIKNIEEEHNEIQNENKNIDNKFKNIDMPFEREFNELNILNETPQRRQDFFKDKINRLYAEYRNNL